MSDPRPDANRGLAELQDDIEALRAYIRDNYAGDITNALESIGGIKAVRRVLGLPDYAVLDSRLYKL